jgi:hypothetical protein
VAKLADARDLKSRDPQGSCGFDSHLRHQRTFRALVAIGGHQPRGSAFGSPSGSIPPASVRTVPRAPEHRVAPVVSTEPPAVRKELRGALGAIDPAEEDALELGFNIGQRGGPRRPTLAQQATMINSIHQCSNCGFIAAVTHPDELSLQGWRLQGEGRPGTYCADCARALRMAPPENGRPATRPMTRAAGSR